MRLRYRLLVPASLTVGFLIFLKVRGLEIWDQYDVPAYVGDYLGFGDGTNDKVPLVGEAGDRVIVMAKMEKENTDWVSDYLPEYTIWLGLCCVIVLIDLRWQNAIYTVDNPNASLHTPENKGHEAMAYLTYVIDHYNSLPAVITFLHSHRNGFWGAWHTDSRLHDNVDSMRKLQLEHVHQEGYVNLRCNWSPGCDFGDRLNTHVTPEIWDQLFGDTPFPGKVGAACCAQFAVSREQVLRRPKSDYDRYRQWLLDTELTDRLSGRVFEYSWQVIFGKEAV